MRSSLLVVGVIFFAGCSVDAQALRAWPDSGAPRRGPGILDAGTLDALPSSPDVLPSSPDAVPSVDSIAAEAPRAASDSLPPDAGLADGSVSSLDAGPAPDLRPVPDAVPAPDAIACTKAGAWTQTYAMLISLPATAGCISICPDSTAAIDYAWACLGFEARDRDLTVNGRHVACGSKDLPPPVNGVWSFAFSPGSSAAAYLQWSGVLRACP